MTIEIKVGDCRAVLATLPDESVDCIVSSPPYFGLRDYGMGGQIGQEESPAAFVEALVLVFREARRVLKADGTLWLNLGDSYAGAGYSNHKNTGGAQRGDGGKQRHLAGTGLKPKNLIGIPWLVAFALQADGWYLRQDIIWAKPNPMPESVQDRCTKSHEYIFLLSKSEKYHFDAAAVREPAVVKNMPGRNLTDTRETYGAQNGGNSGLRDLRRRYQDEGLPTERNKRSVWNVPAIAFKGAHFATFPPELIEPCILAGCRVGGTALDPFGGAGTTGLVADRLGRNAILIELNPEYAALAERRISSEAGMFSTVTKAET